MGSAPPLSAPRAPASARSPAPAAPAPPSTPPTAPTGTDATRAALVATRRVNSPPRRYNGTQSAFADTNGNDRDSMDERAETETVFARSRVSDAHHDSRRRRRSEPALRRGAGHAIEH